MVLEKRESLGQQGSNPSIIKEISPEYSWKDWCWSWSSSTLATWCEELTHWKRPWCWKRLKTGGEGDNRGWYGRWHHRLDGHEFEQGLGVGDGQGSLTCCSPWGHKESDMAEWLNRTELWSENGGQKPERSTNDSRTLLSERKNYSVREWKRWL